MLEPTIQRFSRKCSQTGREILAGEIYYSCLTETPTGVQRQDFSRGGWSGPPDDCVGWWKSRLPLPSQVRIRWAPESVLLAYLEHLLVTQQWPVLNVLALALARRRLLTIEYASLGRAGSPAHGGGTVEGEGGADELILTIRSTGDSHRIPSVDWATIDVAAIQAELDRHLFTDQVEDSLGADDATGESLE